MTSKTINDRMRLALELADDVKQVDIVREFGLSSASVSFWFSEGPRKSVPDIATLSRLAKMLKVNLQWLASGEGPMRLDPPRTNTPPADFSETYTTERKHILTLIDGLDDEQRKTLIAFLRTVV